MELKNLPKDVHYLILMRLDLRSLFNIKITDKYFNVGVFKKRVNSEKGVWLQQTIKLGIYRRSYEKLETGKIIELIKTHVTQAHDEVKAITNNFQIKQLKIDSSSLTFAIAQDDDAEVIKLLANTDQLEKNKFIPLMIQHGRIRCLKSILEGQIFNPSFTWMLLAIHFEQFAIVKYFIDQQNFPLYTTQRFRLIPTNQGRYNPHYKLTVGSRHFAANFQHYNRVLLLETIRCKHVGIVQLIRNRLDSFLYDNTMSHPEEDLYTKLKRHSIAQLDLTLIDNEADDESRELLVGSDR